MNLRRTSPLVLIATILVGALMIQAIERPAGADEKGKMLRHLVLYKFKPEVTDAQLRQVIDAFSGLPKKIEGITAFEHGPNVSPEGKSDGLTYCFVVTFRDEKARDAYLIHPAHQDYVKIVQDKREKVVVFDYWTQ